MKKLTQTEEEIMLMFWELGPSTVSGLIDRMEEPKPPHSTISSIARILEKKGYLKHKKYGRTYEYHPKVEKKNYKAFSLSKLTRSYFEGSMEELVSFMVKEKQLDTEKLRKLIDELENKES